ncbi:hypothetical protein F511_26626 [Dorcoceras hygrometricum]|uniref:Dystroglycan-like n=1 Tax=Dorcoceras hygrometricum TaxID=472368 RepID=A0A2Z7CPC4_9LAMI|nr:hypothetical protein F511_26626 [Dorcoceras hygrometricum]
MASSLISNSHHIDFDAVFGMEDTDLVQMFESLIATGLKNFLGCPAVFNEDALTEFFTNSSVREDGLVVSTVNGVSVEIFEEVFAATFEIPVEGLTDLSEVPKNLVFDARSLFSISKEQVSISFLKKAMKIQYHLLHDILAKTIYVKAGSFDSVTRDRFMLMTAITFDVKINWSSLLFGVLREKVTLGSRQAKGYAIQICVLLRNVAGLELGESKTFPIHRVLNERTVHRYVVINDKLGGEEVVDAPKVKRTPAKKKGVTKKRPAAGDAEVAPIVKKKRTTKGKPVAAKRLPVEEPVGVSTTSEQPVVKVATGEREPVGGLIIASITEATTGDADAAIEQFLAQLDLVIQDSDVERSDRIETWFDRAFDEEFATADQENQDYKDEIDFDVDNQELPVFDEKRTVPEAGGSKSFGVDKAGEKAIGSTHSTEEHMSIDDLLMQISEDMLLPSITAAEITKIRLGESLNIHEVQEHDLYYASLPRISIHDKGKEKLEEDEPVRGNPARETVELICGDVDFLVQLRNKDQLFLLMHWRSNCIVESPESPPPIPQRQESSSSSSDSQMNFDTTDFPLDDTTEAQTSLPAATVEAIDDLRAFILQRIDDSNSAILSKLHTLERGLRDALHDQDENARKLINSVCQDAHTISDVQKIHLNDVKKIVLAQGVTAGADSLEIRKEFKAIDAKINSLDGQVATIRSEHLEFQARISADLLSLSTKIGDLVDYIRSGDAKKGEGSSSRRPLPTPVHRSEGTGDAVRLTEPTQADIDNANRAILERMRNEDSLRTERERDRARRERRLSRSGAYKRRRGF